MASGRRQLLAKLGGASSQLPTGLQSGIPCYTTICTFLSYSGLISSKECSVFHRLKTEFPARGEQGIPKQQQGILRPQRSEKPLTERMGRNSIQRALDFRRA
jgi:hypothetical protein